MTSITPKDFTRSFSKGKKTQLINHLIDERSLFERNKILSLLNPIITLLLPRILIRKRDNDIKKITNRIITDYSNCDLISVKKYLENYFADDHLRKFEYSFLAECLSKSKTDNQIIVDLGGGGSFSTILPVILNIPFKRLLSVDVLHYSLKSKYGIEYIYGNCTKTDLPDSSVDIVTLISTLEHVGLGRYGDPLDTRGDINTMKEAKRILKKGGLVILTIPAGAPAVVYNMHRVYDNGRFKELIKGFKPVIVRYSLYGKPTTAKKLFSTSVTTHIPGYYGNIPEPAKIPDAPGGILALIRKV